MMRMADADLLPFDFVDFADDMQKYVREIEKLRIVERLAVETLITAHSLQHRCEIGKKVRIGIARGEIASKCSAMAISALISTLAALNAAARAAMSMPFRCAT